MLEISFIYEINIRIIKSFISILFTYEKTTGRVVNAMSILQTCKIHAGHTLQGKLRKIHFYIFNIEDPSDF